MLPPALLELTLLRVTRPLTRFTTRAAIVNRWGIKCMHQAALATTPYHLVPDQYELRSESRSTLQSGSPAPRSDQILSDASTELGKRVKALEEAAAAEASALDPPSYTEEELLSLYEDLLAFPPTNTQKVDGTNPEPLNPVQVEEDNEIINAVEQRLLLEGTNLDTPYASCASNTSVNSSTYPSTQPYHRVLSHVHDHISQLESIRASIDHSSATASPHDFVPITLLSISEFEAIGRACVRAQDIGGAELVLNLIKRSGMELPESMVTNVMELYARKGNVAGLEHIIANYLTTYPTERQRHLHIKSHLVSTPAEAIPNSALEVLHSYEAHSPAPMRSYTSIITHLFSSRSSMGRAQAWDLFSHMRYVAHPEPDVPLYTLMIRACASPISTRPSEPERALDLWTEMTVDLRLIPTLGAYDAIILACARSGTKIYVNEAFRLAKQMMDSHRDAWGKSAYTPSRRTFCALLEGAKRLGDLTRARWILAEMTSNQKHADGAPEPEGVNEEVMTHIFHTYASYRTPFQRAAVLSVEGHTTTPDHDNTTSQLNTDQAANVEVHKRAPFTHIPPQSHPEVIHEVEALFDRILHDKGIENQPDPIEEILPRKFRGVQLTSRLLNSYLSVYYNHASLETSRDIYQKVFDNCGISRTGRTYVEALERCATSKRGHERTIALNFAEEVWAQWQSLEEAGQEDGYVLSNRTIEKAHIAMIRVLTLTNNVDRAVQHVRAFVARYPPSDIRTPGQKPALRATRTALVAQRPLVRMTSNTEVPDDHVPPLLMFDDVEILHHRLVALNATAEIRYLSYVCKSYEWALRVRRDAAMKVRPEKQNSSSPTTPPRLGVQ